MINIPNFEEVHFRMLSVCTLLFISVYVILTLAVSFTRSSKVYYHKQYVQFVVCTSSHVLQARLRLSEQVEKEDVKEAIRLTEMSKDSLNHTEDRYGR
jgi:guanylate kinase